MVAVSVVATIAVVGAWSTRTATRRRAPMPNAFPTSRRRARGGFVFPGERRLSGADRKPHLFRFGRQLRTFLDRLVRRILSRRLRTSSARNSSREVPRSGNRNHYGYGKRSDASPPTISPRSTDGPEDISRTSAERTTARPSPLVRNTPGRTSSKTENPTGFPTILSKTKSSRSRVVLGKRKRFPRRKASRENWSRATC